MVRAVSERREEEERAFRGRAASPLPPQAVAAPSLRLGSEAARGQARARRSLRRGAPVLGVTQGQGLSATKENQELALSCRAARGAAKAKQASLRVSGEMPEGTYLLGTCSPHQMDFGAEGH